MPARVQRKRTKGWRMPPNTVYVGRGSKYGNPFNATQTYVCHQHSGFPAPLIKLHSAPSLERCLDMYHAYLYAQLEEDPQFLDDLKGKNLACWCSLDGDCHADLLLKLANWQDR